MTERSDVTVVIPTHRRNDFLPEAIASVLAQELAPAALVVSDDVGDPATREIVQDWAGRASFPVRYLDSSGPGAGTAGASRNAGAALATTSLLAFLDDDDVWHPTFLARLVAALHDDAGFAVAWGAADVPGYQFPRARAGLTARDAVGRNPGFGGCNVVVRTGLFRSLGGFDPQLTVSNDKDLYVRALAIGERYALVPEVLVTYRMHGSGQLTDKTPQRAEGIRRYMTKHEALLSARDRRYLRAQLASVLRVTARGPVRRWWHTGELAALRLVLAVRGPR
ncbi:MAG: glycosyltransferase family 2 protein [Actinomycetales bacterium]|nr:glycosyltransferase family 2 protein [Actinomycetales bacterium]